jgi:hypothetical protein
VKGIGSTVKGLGFRVQDLIGVKSLEFGFRV